jgi:hypothetical protein
MNAQQLKARRTKVFNHILYGDITPSYAKNNKRTKKLQEEERV